ncbi:MAG TPA: MFS transporter [Nocardioidaceae bacterium]|nr:MFS transporter [Nocardioidaceae bacterium]
MIRTLSVTTSCITLAAVPVFLLGALAVFIRDELRFDETQLGVAASLYYLTAALSATPGGRIVERIGEHRGIALAASGTTVAMLAIAALADSWADVVACMMLAGLANGFALPATNLGLARRIPPGRRGMAFGIKQSSGTLATLLSGAAVPILALTVGWRWAFAAAGAAGLPLIVWGIAGRPGRTGSAVRERHPIPTGPLVVLAAAGACGVVAGSSLASFYVESAVAQGIFSGTAGTLLAVGSVVGVAGRVGWGWLGDHCGSAEFRVMSGLLAVGAVGFILLGAATSSARLLLATLLIFGMGWAWPGLFNFAVSERIPAAPAAATGVIGTGLFAGGIVGPVGFGLLVHHASYRSAWSAVAATLLAAGVLVLIGGSWLQRRVT